MLQINIITAFPNYFESIQHHSIIKNAIMKKLVKISIYNLRDFSNNKNNKIDDYIYGGNSPGMLLMVEPFYYAISHIKKKDKKTHIIILCPRGKIFNHEIAVRLSKIKNMSLTFLCGHYEGFDERIYKYVDEIISLGNFITSGGESISNVIIDSIVRLIPGVISNNSLLHETDKNNSFVEWDQYTRPNNFMNHKVPQVLLDGDHKKIHAWRKKSAIKNKIKYKN